MMTKFTCFMLLGLCLLPLGLGAQNLDKLKIKAYYDQKDLTLVLLDLEIEYRLDFVFEREQLEGLSVSVNFPKTPLQDAMKILLQGTGLEAVVSGPRQLRIGAQQEAPPPEKFEPQRFNFSITGVVKDGSTGEALPFATIYLPGSKQGVSTNVDGYFTLLEVPADTVLLEVQYLGYRTRKMHLQPDLDFDNLRIDLDILGQELVEVLVVGEQEEQMLKASTGISRIKVAPAQLSKLPSFGEKDIFRSLQLLPGISGTNESSSGLYVRGGTPDQNLILFDGFTVYHVDHLFGFFSAFNSNAIKDVQLHKGGFEAKFGGRTSSVMELTGKDGNTEAFNMGFGLSLVSVNGYLESPFAKGKGSFLVAGRRSFQSGFYNTLFDAFTEDNSNQGPGGGPGGGRGGFAQLESEPNSYFYDLNAKVTYRLSNKDIVSLSFYNGQDNLDNSRIIDPSNLPSFFQDLDFSFQNDIIDLTEWGNWGTGLKYSRRWNQRFYSNFNLSYSNYYSQRNRSNEISVTTETETIDRSFGTLEDNNLKDYSLKLDNEWKIGSNNQVDFGVQTTFNDIRYDFIRNDTLSVINRDDQGIFAAFYVQDRLTFWDRLILKGGLRSTYFDQTQQWYWEPRASLVLQVTDRVKLKGAWGLYHQFATRVIRQDIQQGSRDFWVLANGDDIPINRSEHLIGGVSFETAGFLIDLEAYRKDYEGLSEYTTNFALAGIGPNATIEYEESFFNGTGLAEGVELLIQKKTGAFTGWIGYTLGRVRYQFDVYGPDDFPAAHDQTHELKLVGSYQWKNWTFAANWLYATGRPYTAPTGAYELTLLDGSTASYFELSDQNALRLPHYHRLDISATTDFSLGNSKGSLGLSIFNLYNRQNVWYKEFEVVEGEVLETNISLLNVTPSLFVTWNLR